MRRTPTPGACEICGDPIPNDRSLVCDDLDCGRALAERERQAAEDEWLTEMSTSNDPAQRETARRVSLERDIASCSYCRDDRACPIHGATQ